ncbi:hypothetical protein Tco_1352153, partial [Tanacetum coccineum]
MYVKLRTRHHFIRDAYEKKLFQVLKIHTDDNVADLLTKAFDVSSPIVSTSLIEQFWNTATSKTINDVSYVKAKVAGKTVSISESSIRGNLLFNDMDGIDLVDEGEGSAQPTEPQPTPSPTQPNTGDQPQVPRDSLEGFDGSKGDQVLDLQKAKDAQVAKILKLKTRIKKLEKKEENAKPGPTLDAFDDLDADLAHVVKKEVAQLVLLVEVDAARLDIYTARPEVHTANAPVSAAGVTISTGDLEVSVVKPRTPPTTTSIFDDEDITMAQTLIKMKEEKLKEKGVAFKDVEDSSRPMRSIT